MLANQRCNASHRSWHLFSDPYRRGHGRLTVQGVVCTEHPRFSSERKPLGALAKSERKEYRRNTSCVLVALSMAAAPPWSGWVYPRRQHGLPKGEELCSFNIAWGREPRMPRPAGPQPRAPTARTCLSRRLAPRADADGRAAPLPHPPRPHRGRIAFGGGHRSADSHRRPRARAGLHGHNMDLAPVDI